MGHLPTFIGDLALILITAGCATILFKILKQPVVLGYIVAGFIAGPHVSWVPTVADMGNVQIWAEIGVIFLLFSLGLEFSFKKLLAVGGTASIATLINMGAMIVTGYIAGRLLGWSSMDCIFLGGMLSMSSTTIIIKAFNDMGIQKRKASGIVFGMLIVEDLAAIVMMVMLSTVAVSNRIAGIELFNNVIRLVFFVLIWFIGGIYLIPTILRRLKKYLTDEMLVIVSVGLCLGMVLFASHVGFSAALGAFVMGSILAETIKSKQIEHLVEPVKNLFGAVFFVSVGMLIEPAAIGSHVGLIILLTFLVLFGRVIFATLGVMASGEGLKVSLQAGFSLAQIGEFSFIIATLGMNLGVISGDLYPVIVAVSIITTFTTPYFIRMATPVSDYISRRIPEGRRKLLDGYAQSGLKTVNTQTTWNRLLRSVLLLTAGYTVILVAIIIMGEQFLTPFVTSHVPGVWGKLISGLAILTVMAPFLRPLLMRKTRSVEFRTLWNDSHFNRGALISLLVLKIGICCALIMMVLVPLFPSYTVILLIISMLVTITIPFIQGFARQSRRIEAHFLKNLTHKERQASDASVIHPEVASALLSKNIHVEEVDVQPYSAGLGKTLRELDFRSRLRLHIVSIIRGGRRINIPDADERLFPYDKLIVAGSDENIRGLVEFLDARAQLSTDADEVQPHIVLSQYVVETNSPLLGKSMIELSIQQKSECMIISVSRGEEAYVHVSASFIFEEGDTLLLAGEQVRLDNFEKSIIAH